MKYFNNKKYEGSKYDYNGNVYEFGGLEKLDGYAAAYVFIDCVNDDTFILLPPEEFEDFHNKYVIK